MERAYVICHMMTSIDGKVTGDFLFQPGGIEASDVYYEINREYKKDAFACGRVTMQGSFCGDGRVELSDCERFGKEDYITEDKCGFYAISFDPHGRCGWKGGYIVDPDGDEGYDGAQIVEVLSEDVDERYLGYLRNLGISYIFAGKEEIDIHIALYKLKEMFGIETLLLEGGSILDGAFMEAGVVDEISIVVAPLVANTVDKPLFMKSEMTRFELKDVKRYDKGIVWLNYKKSEEKI